MGVQGQIWDCDWFYICSLSTFQVFLENVHIVSPSFQKVGKSYTLWYRYRLLWQSYGNSKKGGYQKYRRNHLIKDLFFFKWIFTHLQSLRTFVDIKKQNITQAILIIVSTNVVRQFFIFCVFLKICAFDYANLCKSAPKTGIFRQKWPKNNFFWKRCTMLLENLLWHIWSKFQL